MKIDLNKLSQKFTSTPSSKDILSYESHVWKSADTLRSSVGLKDSDFPRFMMCFLALAMVESRIVRAAQKAISEFSDDAEYYVEEVRASVDYFYNPVIVEEGITLKDIVKVSTGFDDAFSHYLDGFTPQFKELVGIDNGNDDENLNMSSRIKTLKAKNALLAYLSSWAEVDLAPYDNYEITTLEEHIKRKWADMSAETAGEQYTPSDIGYLISLLVAAKKAHTTKSGTKLKIYDMTCGGGNLLYGVEDRLLGLGFDGLTETYGQELNGPLYCLAKIESSFRPSSFIEQGNTLINDKFTGISFDVGVANPPYGVSWSDVSSEVENDETGRFTAGLPSTSDGQLLFVQHMINKLNPDGIAFIVLNGSPMFSGDAGSGESNIRKWILDNDYLEALIQLPSNEFFNTGISTYIWCLNKNKPSKLLNSVVCINADSLFTKLKKNKGEKSKEIAADQAARIASWIGGDVDTDLVKIKSKYDFYYNKQKLVVAELDHEGLRFPENQEHEVTNKSAVISITQAPSDDSSILAPIVGVSSVFLDSVPKSEISEIVSLFGQGCSDANNSVVVTWSENGRNVSLAKIKGSIHLQLDGVTQYKGAGVLSIKGKVNKATKSRAESVQWSVTAKPTWTKDFEKIEFNPDSADNANIIEKFMTKWVSADKTHWQLMDNVVGVEFNFNQVFPKKIEIRSVSDILKDLENL